MAMAASSIVSLSGPERERIAAYLAEIASDVNLPIDKFTGLAEMIPHRARFNEDGMYRAIDIYLKVRISNQKFKILLPSWLWFVPQQDDAY